MHTFCPSFWPFRFLPWAAFHLVPFGRSHSLLDPHPNAGNAQISIELLNRDHKRAVVARQEDTRRFFPSEGRNQAGPRWLVVVAVEDFASGWQGLGFIVCVSGFYLLLVRLRAKIGYFARSYTPSLAFLAGVIVTRVLLTQPPVGMRHSSGRFKQSTV